MWTGASLRSTRHLWRGLATAWQVRLRSSGYAATGGITLERSLY